MNRIVRSIVSYPITLFGLISFLLLVLSAPGTVPIHGPLWPVIAPSYVLHLLFVAVAVLLFGPGRSDPEWLVTVFFIVTLPLRFAPFLLADRLLARFRRPRHRTSGVSR